MRYSSFYVTKGVTYFFVNLHFTFLLLQITLPFAIGKEFLQTASNNEQTLLRHDKLKREQESHTSRNTQPSNTYYYGRLTLAQIYSQMDELASSYPDFVTVTTSQDEFGLPSSCQQQETQHIGCQNKYIVLEDPIIYSSASAATALKQRPDVYLSGALHGDERVGPVAVLETAKLLARAASCESGVLSNDHADCVDLYSKYTVRQTAWLARLVSTRRIVITPATNAKGYYNNMREETYRQSNGSTSYIDPNRDFTFDNSPSQCMRSITARTVNELFRNYLFQMSMTYHGGIESISFEWGAISIPSNRVSPDDYGQRIMADKMSTFAGELSRFGSLYPTDDMNAIVYPVYGGFEDYVYAGSWKNDLTVQCSPNTYGGYSASKTTFDDATLATFNFLVETSNSKDPATSAYGSDYNLLNPPYAYDGNVHNGYAAKNVRTSLMAIDAVEPYVQIFRFKKKYLYRELKPLTALSNRWAKASKKGSGTVKQTKIPFRWYVGGAFTVDETFLVYGSWTDFPSTFNAINQITDDEINQVLNDNSGAFTITASKSGDTIWSDPSSANLPEFVERVNLSRFSAGDSVAVFAVAKVDQSWANQPSNIWPNVDVQTHMVNIRTNTNYNKSKSGIGREVQGRLYWISVPFTIKVKG